MDLDFRKERVVTSETGMLIRLIDRPAQSTASHNLYAVICVFYYIALTCACQIDTFSLSSINRSYLLRARALASLGPDRMRRFITELDASTRDVDG
jgi:hypothetical protein